MTAPTVKVKPLVWEDADEGMCTKWRAPALGGSYELVSFKGEEGFAVNFYWGRPLSFWFIQGEPDEFGYPTGPKMFPDLEAAKAAAQADYEARALSAIDTTDLEARIGAALAEAAGLMPRYFGVWSSTGVHIGVWDDGATAAKVLGEYPRGVMRDLVDAQDILALHPTALTALDRAKRAARVEVSEQIWAAIERLHVEATPVDALNAIAPIVRAMIEKEGKP